MRERTDSAPSDDPITLVLAAYGPPRTTREAVKRARALIGPRGSLKVVAAIRPGLESARRSGAEPVEGSGSDALKRAIAESPEAPVLLVHDDMLLTAGAVKALRAELRRSRGFVIPYTNDLGMDHFCGPLPEVRKAGSQVHQRAKALRGAAGPVQVVRPACILAQRNDLLNLVGSHLADPRLKLDVVDLPFRIAPGAVVAHDSACNRRNAPPWNPANGPLLTAAMIVRDEEEMLEQCLASLSGLVDEIVVCDTGSVDRTVEIAESFGAKVIHREWRNDFGWARTEALKAAARAQWILTVDADDRMQCADPAAVRAMLATYIDEYEAFNITVENRRGMERASDSLFESPRIFRGGHFHYEGAVHETLIPDNGDFPLIPRLEYLGIIHVGYEEKVVSDRNKKERNLSLARGQFESDPSPKHALEYARSLRMAGEHHEKSYALMAGIVQKLIEAGEGSGSNARAIAYVLSFMADDKLELGDPEIALKHAEEALKIVPADDASARFYARAALALGRPQDVVDMERKRSATPSMRPIFRSDVSKVSVQSLLCIAHVGLGQVDEAAAVAAEALERAPEHFHGWEALTGALATRPEATALPLLVDLALKDPSGRFVDPVVNGISAAWIGRFALLYMERGGRLPLVLSTGLMASLVANEAEVFMGLAQYGEMLDVETAERIAGRAAARGREDLALALQHRLQLAGATR